MDKPKASPEAAHAVAPAFIKLTDDWAHHRAGTVLRADPELLAMLEVEGAKFTAATDLERGLAGF